MKNYASLSNGFYALSSQNKLINNNRNQNILNNYNNNNQARMISSLELNKAKNRQNIYGLNPNNNFKNININYYAPNNPIPLQNQYSNFNKNSITSQKRQRNMSSGNNIIKKDYNIKKMVVNLI